MSDAPNLIRPRERYRPPGPGYGAGITLGEMALANQKLISAGLTLEDCKARWKSALDDLEAQRIRDEARAVDGETLERGGVVRNIQLAPEYGPDTIVPYPDGRKVHVVVKGARLAPQCYDDEDGPFELLAPMPEGKQIPVKIEEGVSRDLYDRTRRLLGESHSRERRLIWLSWTLLGALVAAIAYLVTTL